MSPYLRSADLILAISGSIFAERLLWPLIHPHRVAVHRTEFGSHDDCQKAIDAFVWLEQPGHASLRIPLQERFRGMQFAHYRDMTLSLFCERSQRECEYYHMDAVGWILYGYFDLARQTFGECVLVSVSGAINAIKAGTLPVTREYNPVHRKHFLAARFDDLEAQGLVLWHANAPRRCSRIS